MYHQVSKKFYLSLFLVVAYAAFLNVPCFVDACFVSKKEKETPTYSFYHYVSLLNSKKIALFSLKNKINHLKNTTKNIFEKTNKKTSTFVSIIFLNQCLSASPFITLAIPIRSTAPVTELTSASASHVITSVVFYDNQENT